MQCGQCGNDNPEGARFCSACGSALLQPRGPVSYTPRHLTAQALTQGPALQGERKQVTILFADVKGSTALAAAIGDEQWHSLLDGFFTILSAGVHRYDGTINQYTGDGIMALFGAPIALEDHAQRACRAALALQTELREYADRLRMEQGISWSVRMGLNSGEVVVGAIGDALRRDYTAQGHAVNLAARMEEIAEPGRIYITGSTAALVRDEMRLRELGSMQVKGATEPVPVYELEAAGAAVTRLQRSGRRGLSGFVGRDAEMARLNQALAAARDGDGQVLLLRGEAGIGKSRLCHEFAEQVRAQGIPVYTAACLSYGRAMPMAPVITLLQNYFGISGQDSPLIQRRKIAGTLTLDAAGCQEACPQLFELLGVAEEDTRAAPLTKLPAEQTAENQMQRWSALVQRILLPARHTPVVIMVEDLHWVDGASEQCFTQLVAQAAQHQLLLLFNQRPEFAAPWLQLPPANCLDLGVLSGSALTDMLCQRLDAGTGRRQAHLELAQRISERAGGNPYFAEEALQSLIDQALLVQHEGRWLLQAAADELPLPDSVQGILATRLDHLPADAKALLQTMAVFGRRWQRQRLAGVLAQLSPDLDHASALERLLAGGFVEEDDEPGADYRFRHSLMQEVAYRTLLREQRRRTHALLAGLLEAELQGSPREDERVAQLAFHLERGGEEARAARAWLRAGLSDGLNGDPSDAAHYYSNAIALFDRLPRDADMLPLALQARAGLVRSASMVDMDLTLARRAFDEGLAMAAAGGHTLALAELRLARGTLALKEGDADRAHTEVALAVQIVREYGDEQLLARFRIPFLFTFSASGRLREGIDALNPPAASGQQPWHAQPVSAENFLSRGYYGYMLAYMGDIAGARTALDAAVAVERSQQRTVGWLHSLRVDLALMSGDDLQASLREARMAMERAEATGNGFFQSLACRAQATALLLNEQPLAAAELLRDQLPQVAPGAVAHQFEAVVLATYAEALRASGRLTEALIQGQAAAASALSCHTRLSACHAHLVLARVYRQQRDWEQAALQRDALQRSIEETGAGSFTPWRLLEHAECQLAQGNSIAAELLFSARDAFAAIGAQGWARQLDARLEAAA